MTDAFQLPKTAEDEEELVRILSKFEEIVVKIQQAGAFVICLQSQNTNDQKANEHKARISRLNADFKSALVTFDHKLARIDDAVWKKLLNRKDLQEIAYILQERRERIAEKLSADQETLIEGLAVDGYHAWGICTTRLSGKSRFRMKINNYPLGRRRICCLPKTVLSEKQCGSA